MVETRLTFAKIGEFAVFNEMESKATTPSRSSTMCVKIGIDVSKLLTFTDSSPSGAGNLTFTANISW